MRIVAALLLLTALAGCSEDATPTVEEEPFSDEVQVESDLGAISGILVSETIVPIEGALMTLHTGVQTTSNADGQYVFEDLEPGVYFLDAEAEGYLPTQTSVEVLAGEIANPRILLKPDTSPVPYTQTHQFTGRMVVSDFYAVYILSEVIGNNELCTCYFEFDTEAGVQTVVSEAVWESSTTRVDGHEIYWDLYASGSAVDARWATSPMLWHQSGLDQAETLFALQASSDLQPDVEQDFEGFVTFFYVAGAPEGWSVVAGDL